MGCNFPAPRPDIMPMPDAGQIAKQRAIAEIGAHKLHIGQMRATNMRVVENKI